jgi:hypothetical protein
MSETPIALFVYNRPQHTQRLLESLADCARLEECRLYVFCDGPKSAEQRDEVEAARAVARKWAAHHEAEIIESVENRGLARSIVAGVGRLCDEYGRVIVVEDDFVLSPLFLDYMLQALERYADEERVYQISGYMFPVEHPAQTDAFFLPLTTTWGWATWRRAWRIFDWEARGARAMLADPNERLRFDLDGSYPYSAMLEQRLKGENDSWGILWWWSVFKAGGLVLQPRRSLVWNGGFDGSGSHCGDASGLVNASPAYVLEYRLTSPLRLPVEVVEDEKAFNRVKRFLRESDRSPSLTTRLRRRLARYV